MIIRDLPENQFSFPDFCPPNEFVGITGFEPVTPTLSR